MTRPRCAKVVLHVEIGTFEAFIYPMFEWGTIDLTSCSFGLSYPQDWSILSVELCNGVVSEGNLYDLRSGITVTFSPCVSSDLAVLHLIVGAPSVGRMALAPGPLGRYGFASCQAQYHPYWGDYSYIEVGDVCGSRPLGSPCDYCLLHYTGPRAATFTPPTLQLATGTGGVVFADVQVDPGDQCTSIPECGGWPQPCFDTLRSHVPWLTYEWILGGIRVRADAQSLPPGLYHGGIEAIAGSCCLETCLDVELTVNQPTAIEDPSLINATWGGIKSTYK